MTATRSFSLSLTTKIKLLSTACCVASLALGLLFYQLVDEHYAWWSLVIAAVLTGLCTHWLTRPLNRSLAALNIGLLNFRDQDFSVSLPLSGDHQLRDLAANYNASAKVLRQQRQSIYQRELLLDKVIQSSPNVMLLTDDSSRIIYANHAARQAFKQGIALEGRALPELLTQLPAPVQDAFEQRRDGLFSWETANAAEGEEQSGSAETWHLSTGRFLLNNQYHHLYLLKQMTRELNRQEVAVWKKVIRVISHELNNSLAPISSMVNSGKRLTRELNDDNIKLIFDTIEERTQHLSQFIFGYARFAKLPLPQRKIVDWEKLTSQLAQQYHFLLEADYPPHPVQLDVVQLEQVLLNLLKNAHESGSAAKDIRLIIVPARGKEGSRGVSISVEDRGCGMSTDVLQQALLPFYSTKLSGTGLGLPLCREIIEAHGGHINLQNRQDGGLRVQLWFPA